MFLYIAPIYNRKEYRLLKYRKTQIYKPITYKRPFIIINFYSHISDLLYIRNMPNNITKDKV